MRAIAIVMFVGLISLGYCDNWFKDYVLAKDDEGQADDDVDVEGGLDEGRDLKYSGVNKIIGSSRIGLSFGIWFFWCIHFSHNFKFSTIRGHSCKRRQFLPL